MAPLSFFQESRRGASHCSSKDVAGLCRLCKKKKEDQSLGFPITNDVVHSHLRRFQLSAAVPLVESRCAQCVVCLVVEQNANCQLAGFDGNGGLATNLCHVGRAG